MMLVKLPAENKKKRKEEEEEEEMKCISGRDERN